MKIRKIMICLALCLTLIAGGSMTALASSGNISYGGTKATWSMSTSKATASLQNISTTTLRIKSKLYYKNKSTGVTSSISNSKKVTKTSYISYSESAPSNCSFVKNSSNKFTYLVSGSQFTSCSPQP